MVKLSDEDIADFEVLRNVAMATTFGFYRWGAHWRHLENTTEPSMCDDVALCQLIALTTWLYSSFFIILLPLTLPRVRPSSLFTVRCIFLIVLYRELSIPHSVTGAAKRPARRLTVNPTHRQQ